MQPKNLTAPSLQEGICVVAEKQPLPPLFEIFGNNNPIHVEFCTGNGEWITEQALKTKEVNWIAVEKQFARVRKIWSKKKNHELDNLFIVFGRGEDFLAHHAIDSLVDHIYVNFPDPWPKTRHAKHRIIKTSFVESLVPITKVGSLLTIVTDDIPYAEEIVREVQKSPRWESAMPAPYYMPMPMDYGPSYFQRLFIAQQKEIRMMQFVRSDEK